MNSPVRFDDALAGAITWVKNNRSSLGDDVHLVRDIYGHIRVLPGGNATIPTDAMSEGLRSVLGAFGPTNNVFLDIAFFPLDELRLDRVPIGERTWLIDRLVSEQGWRRPPVAGSGRAPRVIFFGIKGGVGRSTALVAMAKKFTERNQRVLVVDLDLESPGATSMLLRAEELPTYGVVDWFVEDAVGQGDDALLRGMVAISRVGGVSVAPAVGTCSVPDDKVASPRDGAFIAKLGRAYASPDGSEFAARIERLLEGLERVHEPDVILIDSRAGMHDISAAAVPRLGGTVLMFAGATSQTWLAYRLLFSAWARDRDVLARFRAKLRVVSAMVPETGRDTYSERIRLAAYDLFAGYVYDASDTSDVDEPFTYDISDPDAPHAPLPIYWRRELTEWEPAIAPGTGSEGLTPEQFEAAFAPFLRGALELPDLADLAPRKLD